MKRSYFISFIILLLFLTPLSSFSQEWKNVGNSGFSSNGATYQSMVLDSNNNPYVAFSESEVTVMKFNGTSWENTGLPKFADYGRHISLAIDKNDVLYVAFRGSAANFSKLTVMKFNGTLWEIVGSKSFSAGMVEYVSLKIDGNGVPYVAFQDEWNSYKITVMKFNGTSWENVGSPGFSKQNAKYISLDIDSSNIPYVAFQDAGDGQKASVMKFNGANWVYVGIAGFSSASSSHQSLAIDSKDVPYIAYYSVRANVLKFNGTSWENVGSANFANSAYSIRYINLVIDNKDDFYIAFQENLVSYKSNVMKFDGNNWNYLGSSNFTPGVSEYQSLTVTSDNVPYIAFSDGANSGKTTVMKFTENSLAVKNVNIEGLKLFPNSVKESFTISANTIITKVAIYNFLGKKIMESKVNNKKINLDTSRFASGIYLVKINSNDKTQTLKLVKE
jgi:hypothetical protein